MIDICLNNKRNKIKNNNINNILTKNSLRNKVYNKTIKWLNFITKIIIYNILSKCIKNNYKKLIKRDCSSKVIKTYLIFKKKIFR